MDRYTLNCQMAYVIRPGEALQQRKYPDGVVDVSVCDVYMQVGAVLKGTTTDQPLQHPSTDIDYQGGASAHQRRR
jgi:hypothetical protein